MEKRFNCDNYRKDASLVVFSSNDNKGLLGAICCNPFTGYVKQTSLGSVLVPKNTVKKIEKYLTENGWVKN